ncbi:two-component system sensor histidine kinase NtrB [Gorillibacterium timonense]|uniref:two-component system sensor histidine kinase NtrB n=1 Tax=Gorillibacterium timonense TaxID=1689269 RepID=UPI00071DEA7F|nr:ATP-binding protein [Gorillibacterium timonense]
MISRIVYYVVFPLYVVFVVYSSITLGKDLNEAMLISLGLLLIVSMFSDIRFPKQVTLFSVLQFLILFSFHYVSQLNWCYSLYIILLSKVLYPIKKVSIAIFVGAMSMLLYTGARLSYMDVTKYNYLAVVSDFLTSLAVVFIIQYIVKTEREKNQLIEQIERESSFYQSEKLKVIGELAAGMAHEIRNPLTTIKGFLQLSKSQNYNIKPWYELLSDEVERMTELTGEFLEFSKPRITCYQVSSMHECLQKVISLTESEARILRHQLQYSEYSPDLHVYMDADKMVQVFVNLIKNALEAMTEPGKVTIRLYNSKGWVHVVLTDTGKGIRPADLKKIFDPFFTTKQTGTGLGLSISLKIIQDHGGKLEVSSTEGQGTSFMIRLPLRTREVIEAT